MKIFNYIDPVRNYVSIAEQKVMSFAEEVEMLKIRRDFFANQYDDAMHNYEIACRQLFWGRMRYRIRKIVRRAA